MQSTVIAEASVKLSATKWQSADGKFTYTQSGADLIVTINGDVGGSVTLKDFKDGDYSIHLREARTNPQTTNAISGNVAPIDFDHEAASIHTQADGLGSVIVTGEAAPDCSDALNDTNDADRVRGWRRKDVLGGFAWDSVKNDSSRMQRNTMNDLIWRMAA